MGLGSEDAAGEGKRLYPRLCMQLPCQNNVFDLDQAVAVINRLLSGAMEGETVAATRHPLACCNLTDGLIEISAVATARRPLD